MPREVTLETVLPMVYQLSTEEKLNLIQKIMPKIQRDLRQVQAQPRTSLRGLWRGLDITADDIATARHEMWGDFPRQDI